MLLNTTFPSLPSLSPPHRIVLRPAPLTSQFLLPTLHLVVRIQVRKMSDSSK
jgi:hypothetical protein